MIISHVLQQQTGVCRRIYEPKPKLSLACCINNFYAMARIGFDFIFFCFLSTLVVVVLVTI
jgi:hypothetical protein